jgi:hypothetical protein
MSNASNIIKGIEKSVLVIGPGIYQDNNGGIKEYASKYAKLNNGLVQKYFEQYHLFMPKTHNSGILIQQDFADFYKGKYIDTMKDLYFKISQIPFPLVISLNPDHTLISCFNKLKMEHNVTDDFYKQGKNNLKNKTPSKKYPYVLNLVGSASDPESLILTFDDLFDYLKNILMGNDIPASIRVFIQKARHIVFLGVEFDKWYFQLLVKLLIKFEGKYKALRYAVPIISRDDDDNVSCICEKCFEITFIDHEIKSFINELYYHSFKHKINKLRGKPILSNGKIFDPEIFISYKKEGESEKFAEKVINNGIGKGYNIIYDKKDLKYQADIWEFMKRIGSGKYIILIISKKYLESEYCMFEFKELSFKGSVFENRVFPIVMNDADIHNWRNYERHWDGEIANLISNRLLQNNEKISRYEDIRVSMPDMIKFLDKKKYLTDQEIIDNDFDALFNAIDEKIKDDLGT